MTHDERIERIARAVERAANRAVFQTDAAYCTFVAEAAYRATLEAIREPSEAMLSDIPDAITRALENEGLSWRPYDVYQAVIDHLLNANPSLEDERIAAMEGK